MCSHYEAPTPAALRTAFAVEPPAEPGQLDLYPYHRGVFLRRPAAADAGDEAVPRLEALVGSFGLIPRWTKDRKDVRSTFNARSETAATKNSFREPWRRQQHCIIPAAAIWEPDWRTGKAIPTRITRTDGEPMGVAGLWEHWRGPEGEVHSFTMLTINADTHELMRNFHRPKKERRMVVILPRGLYDAWLDAPPEKSMDFMRQFPARLLQAKAGPST